jgi:hypothetical protein
MKFVLFVAYFQNIWFGNNKSSMEQDIPSTLRSTRQTKNLPYGMTYIENHPTTNVKNKRARRVAAPKPTST